MLGNVCTSGNEPKETVAEEQIVHEKNSRPSSQEVVGDIIQYMDQISTKTKPKVKGIRWHLCVLEFHCLFPWHPTVMSIPFQIMPSVCVLALYSVAIEDISHLLIQCTIQQSTQEHYCVLNVNIFFLCYLFIV